MSNLKRCATVEFIAPHAKTYPDKTVEKGSDVAKQQTWLDKAVVKGPTTRSRTDRHGQDLDKAWTRRHGQDDSDKA